MMPTASSSLSVVRLTRRLLAAALAGACAAWAAGPSVAVANVSAFTSPGAASVTIVGTTATGETANILNPLMNGDPVVTKLAGAEFQVKFSAPVTLRRVAIPRVGWDDWAVPDRVAITIDGKALGEFALSAPRVRPKAAPQGVDVIDFGREIRAARMTIEVLKTSVLKNMNKHGTFRLLVPKTRPQD